MDVLFTPEFVGIIFHCEKNCTYAHTHYKEFVSRYEHFRDAISFKSVKTRAQNFQQKRNSLQKKYLFYQVEKNVSAFICVDFYWIHNYQGKHKAVVDQ